MPIGEPGRQALATERNRPTIHPVSGVGHKTLFGGGDHDAGSSRDNAVPTVTLLCDIPEDPSESFYHGQVYVAVKSSTLQPSTVVRAHTELGSLLLNEKGEHQSMAFLLTDGGPEHNLTFLSVQVGLILMFRMLDLDQLIVGRSCPQNSWTNEVERVMSNLNYALYSMCFTRLPMSLPGMRQGSYSASSIDSPVDYKNTEWLEQQWRSSHNLSTLRERLEANVDFHDAAMESTGNACEEMTLRFLNLVWADEEIKRGYIANNTELKEFVRILSTIDPATGEHSLPNYKKSDVFTSNKMKELFKKPKSINEYISTHCLKSAYTFQIKAVCWKETALEEIKAGRNPDELVGEFHPTCPYNCKRPQQLLSLFALTEFMPCPDKDLSSKEENTDFLSYSVAKNRIVNGAVNTGDKYVPSLIAVDPKVKWIVPPVNTKGNLFDNSRLFHILELNH